MQNKLIVGLVAAAVMMVCATLAYVFATFGGNDASLSGTRSEPALRSSPPMVPAERSGVGSSGVANFGSENAGAVNTQNGSTEAPGVAQKNGDTLQSSGYTLPAESAHQKPTYWCHGSTPPQKATWELKSARRGPTHAITPRPLAEP